MSQRVLRAGRRFGLPVLAVLEGGPAFGGEREIMDDKARASEGRRIDEIVRSDCGPLPASSQKNSNAS